MIITKQFPSATQSGVIYTTTLDPATGKTSCDCRGWIYSSREPRSCRHTKAIVAAPGSTTYTKVAPPDGFVQPMLAGPVPENMIFSNGWFAEEKFDGHRLIVEVNALGITAWSRLGKERALPKHVLAGITCLPIGTYDGELIAPGLRSYGTADHDNADVLVYVIFDVLGLLDQATMGLTYTERRALLEEIFKRLAVPKGAGIALSVTTPISSWEEACAFAKDIWTHDGEGAILKNGASTYEVGKRSKNWLKVKKLQTAVLTVLGFTEGKLGPYSTVNLVDEDGNTTIVKTKNTVERERIANDPTSFFGRRLRIEFQERTPDGSYRHPMWDRFEDE